MALSRSLRQYAFKLRPALRHRPAGSPPRPRGSRPPQRHHRPSASFTTVRSPAGRSKNKDLTLCCSLRQYESGLQAAARHRRSGGSAPRHRGRPLHHRGRPPSVWNAKRTLGRTVLERDRRQREDRSLLAGTSSLLAGTSSLLAGTTRRREDRSLLVGTTRRWPQRGLQGRHRRWPPQRHHRPSARFTTVRSAHHFPHMCSTDVRAPRLLPQTKYYMYQSHRSGRRIQRRQHVQQVRQSSSCHWCHCSPNRSFRCHSGCSSPVHYRFQHGCLHRAMQLACHRQHTSTYRCPGEPQGNPPPAHGTITRDRTRPHARGRGTSIKFKSCCVAAAGNSHAVC